MATQSRRVRDESKPEPPRRPVNAYFLYSAEKRQEFRDKHPSKNQAELSKMMAAAYRDLPSQKRRRYEEMYNIAKKNYDRDYHAYIEKYGRPHKKQTYEDRLEEKYQRAQKQWSNDYGEYAAKQTHLSPPGNDYEENDYKESVTKRTHRSPTANDYEEKAAKHTHRSPTVNDYEEKAAKHSNHSQKANDYAEVVAKHTHHSQKTNNYEENAAKRSHHSHKANDYGEDAAKQAHRSHKAKPKHSSPIEISDKENKDVNGVYECEVQIKDQGQQEIFEDNFIPWGNDDSGFCMIEEKMAEEKVEVPKRKNETPNQKMAEEKIEDVKRKSEGFNLKMIEEKAKDVKLKSDAFNLFDLYMVKSFIDIIFEVGNKDFSAHKLILAKRCKFFDNLFKSGISDGYRLKISDTKPEYFEALLRFIYGDPNLTVDVDSARELLALSDKYLVPALRTNCELALIRMLSVENFTKVARSADAMHSTFMKKALCKFVARHASILKEKGELVGLPKPILVQIFVGFAALAK